jgi:LacI family transcriptional regulator
MRSSIRQVAARAGVSPMTVSNVLRDHADKMSEETRQRVLQSIHDLDYVPVRAAAQNRHVTTHAIGVVFLWEMEAAVSYPTFFGMCHRARELDHDLTVFLRSEPDWVKPGTEAQFLDRRCDGFIFVGDKQREISAALIRQNIPVVECFSVHPVAGAAHIISDNASGMRQAVQYLVGVGHRRIAHLAGARGNSEAEARCVGYRDAMCEIGLPEFADCIVQADTWGDFWGFGKEDKGMLSRPFVEAVLKKDVTAVVCTNDLFALALWRMAEEKGLRVPEDLSITGMDNIMEGTLRGLTSVGQPFEQIGQAAVNAVIDILKGVEAVEASRVLPVELIRRASVVPPPCAKS